MPIGRDDRNVAQAVKEVWEARSEGIVAKDNPTIVDGLNTLSTYIDILDKSINEIYLRLDLILRPDYTTGANPDKLFQRATDALGVLSGDM